MLNWVYDHSFSCLKCMTIKLCWAKSAATSSGVYLISTGHNNWDWVKRQYGLDCFNSVLYYLLRAVTCEGVGQVSAEGTLPYSSFPRQHEDFVFDRRQLLSDLRYGCRWDRWRRRRMQQNKTLKWDKASIHWNIGFKLLFLLALLYRVYNYI